MLKQSLANCHHQDVAEGLQSLTGHLVESIDVSYCIGIHSLRIYIANSYVYSYKCNSFMHDDDRNTSVTNCLLHPI